VTAYERAFVDFVFTLQELVADTAERGLANHTVALYSGIQSSLVCSQTTIPDLSFLVIFLGS
jgi:hypothetical protein